MVIARPKDGGSGTRLREKQDDDKDEPVSIAANTRFDKADSLQSDTGDTGGGSSSSSGGTSVQSSDRPLRGAVGSASLNIGVDNDTGEAVETLSSMGSGGVNSTEGVTTEGTTDVATVDASQSVATVERTEQAVEDATDGTAFGDPNETEDIGSGEAVVTTAGGSSDSTGGGSGGLPELPVDPLIIGALALVAVAVVAGGGDGSA